MIGVARALQITRGNIYVPPFSWAGGRTGCMSVVVPTLRGSGGSPTIKGSAS